MGKNSHQWQYLRISFMPCVGVGTAISALVGKAIGAGDHQQAMCITRRGAALMLGYMLVLSLLILVGRESMIGFFSDDIEVIKYDTSAAVR